MCKTESYKLSTVLYIVRRVSLPCILPSQESRIAFSLGCGVEQMGRCTTGPSHGRSGPHPIVGSFKSMRVLNMLKEKTTYHEIGEIGIASL